MSLDSVQKKVTGFSPRVEIFEDMQREDFLALAAALRRFNACQVHARVPEPPRRIIHEARLLLQPASLPGRA